ncbi:hypothetical protein [Segeticoccus rhizosphaerae]|uniref:hypothetical protein n=1 Tax=Segeticoccus rhizosphaerae TaxID=1104777 RepID=UPI0012646F6D|nr:hypothetical protein [Segeticoccus rhizosphaerae]
MRRLTGWSRVWRALVTVAVLGLVINGTARGDDQQWPFGPMSQFAFEVSNSGGTVRSVYVEALTVQGTMVRVPLDAQGIGLPRAEIEEQLGRFERDPSLLQAIAVAHARRHSDQPRYRVVYLRNEVTRLEHGKAVSHQVETPARWVVRDPANPQEIAR